jgi:anti-sigma regulatory factor (Ser/Thr protein kinase)
MTIQPLIQPCHSTSAHKSGGDTPPVRSIDLPCDRAQVRAVRAFLRANLLRVRPGDPELVEDAVLVGSELASNAVCHAATVRGMTVAWKEMPGGGVRISVADGSRIKPRRVPRPAAGERGRGLDVVAGLSAAWGTRLRRDGKVVFAELLPDEPTLPAVVPAARSADADPVAERDQLLGTAPIGGDGQHDFAELGAVPGLLREGSAAGRTSGPGEGSRM